MYRKTTLCPVVFMALLACACFAHADDAQDIRDLIIKESVGHHKGDTEQIMLCFAPDAILCWQMTDDPEDLLIWAAGLKEIREKYASRAHKRENIDPTLEVRHVHVYGDNAVAVSRHWKMGESDIIEGTHHSVWMLKKINGQWKISCAIAAVKRDDE
ncbi:MAG: DUF4440 domain-containing protein [Candidatus Latescibacteria bacterium]|nr:DUF4440 domain-containing protein [Candidatus Latescibacterota bacterium]